jgi:hypothetical protein
MRGEKRGLKAKAKFSNRFIYSLIAFAVLISVSIGVYALTPGTAPNPGHDISSISPPAGCTANQYLQFDGTNWKCSTVTIPSAGTSSQWTGTTSIYFNGNVGIGTASPVSTLSVGGKGFTNTGIWGNSYGNPNNGIGIYGNDSSTKGVGVEGHSDTNGLGYGVYGDGYIGIQGVGRNAGVIGTTLSSGDGGTGVQGISYTTNSFGVVGTANGAGSYGVYSNGNMKATGSVAANSFLYASDKSLKTNIQPLSETDILDKIKQLKGVSFNWKSNDKADIGLIAQDVETVFPQLVSTDSKGIKSVEYGNLVAVLIEGMKEQQKQIDELKSKCS